MRWDLIRKYKGNERLGYSYAVGDVHWGPTEALRYPVVCMVAGIFACMFGIGGGIVKSPLMIELGVQKISETILL